MRPVLTRQSDGRWTISIYFCCRDLAEVFRGELEQSSLWTRPTQISIEAWINVTWKYCPFCGEEIKV